MKKRYIIDFIISCVFTLALSGVMYSFGLTIRNWQYHAILVLWLIYSVYKYTFGLKDRDNL